MGKSGKRDSSQIIISDFKPIASSDFTINMSCSIANNAENDFTVYITYGNDLYSYFYIIEWDKATRQSIPECLLDFNEYISAVLNISSLPSLKEINDLILALAKQHNLKLPNDIRSTKTVDKIQTCSEIIKYSGETTIIESVDNNVFYYIENRSGKVVKEIIDNTDIKLERAPYSKIDRNIKVNKFPTGDNKINLQINFNSENTAEQLHDIFYATPRTIATTHHEPNSFDNEGGTLFTLTIWYENSETSQLANTSIGEIFRLTEKSLNTFVGITKQKGLL